jgi:multicomponent Na+:H+ antiporter subunit A
VLIAVSITFLAALVAPPLTRLLGHRAGWWLALLPAGLTAWYLRYLPSVAAGEVVIETTEWVPRLGITLTMRMDGLSLLMALIVAVIGTAIVVYAGGYLRGDAGLPRFYLILLAFMGAMLGLVTADDLIALFVFWELTSITSYFLVGFKHKLAETRASALQALLVTAGGGLAMLAGFLLIMSASGTSSISALLADPGPLLESPLLAAVIVLVAIGAFTKSAQFPFHFWLPNAMAAPTPVSAYLHSATMVKAGVYLLARLAPVFTGEAVWVWTLTLVGAVTVVVAASLALLQRDTKALLAYSTVVALATMVMLIGVGGEFAGGAVVVFLLAHALYKAPLFMVAGSVDHEAGTRDVTVLGGLGRRMPVTFATGLAAGVSAAGLPPLFGFIAKEVAYEAFLGFFPWLLVALVAAGAVLLMVAALVVWKPFVGRELEAPREVHEAPPAMLVGPAVLATAGLLLGLAPGLVVGPLLVPAAVAVIGAPYSFYLELWHGFTPELALSAVTVALGLLLSWRWVALNAALRSRFEGAALGPAAVYGRLMDGFIPFAEAFTRRVQPEDLRVQLTVIIGMAVAAAGITGLVHGSLGLRIAHEPGFFFEYVILAVAVAAALAAVAASSRLVAIIALGVLGFAIAVVFVFFAAPDLAITQFVVETLIVIIVAVVLIRLPHGSLRESGRRTVRLVTAAIAVAGGLLVTSLLLGVTALPLDQRLSDFFASESYPSALGRNIVNVILVDFRATDTLGEIAVLVLAAIGVFALLRRAVRGGAVRGGDRAPDPDGGGSDNA